MRHILKKYPVVAIILLLLACVRFQYNEATWSISIPGLAGGVIVLAIIAIVLVYRIFNRVQDVCISKGVLGSRIHCKYDVLIPIAILAAFIKGYWQGDFITGMYGKDVPQWELAWSDPGWDAAFIGFVIGVVLLLRVLQLLKKVEVHAQQTPIA